MLRSISSAINNLYDEYSNKKNIIVIDSPVKEDFIKSLIKLQGVSFLGNSKKINGYIFAFDENGSIECIFKNAETRVNLPVNNKVIIYYKNENIVKAQKLTKLLSQDKPYLFKDNYIFVFYKIIDKKNRIKDDIIDDVIIAKNSYEAKKQLNKFEEYAIKEITLDKKEKIKMELQNLIDKNKEILNKLN